MPLSDRDILRAVRQGDLEIEPLIEDNLQPASLDVCLDDAYRVPRTDVGTVDLADVRPGHTTLLWASRDEPIRLKPGAFILASTIERFTLGSKYAARVEGRSSLGRLGAVIHSTAGFVDPGFSGQITLELSNVAPWDLLLYPGMRIGQVAFFGLDTQPNRLYGERGSYQGQVGPQESRFVLD